MGENDKDEFEKGPAVSDPPEAGQPVGAGMPVKERVEPNPNPVINVGDEEIEEQRSGGPGQQGEVEVK